MTKSRKRDALHEAWLKNFKVAHDKEILYVMCYRF